MNFSVYKHTSPSGKVYIGITSQPPKKRWNNGRGYANSPHFYAAIQAYGWENFKHEILATGLSITAAEEMEKALIIEYDSTNRCRGYNVDAGGSTGAKHTEQTKKKIGDANRGRVWSETSKEKLRQYRLTHPITPETAKKIGAANQGRTHRPESIEKIRAAHLGKSVVNLDTGTVYSGVGEAARACHTDPSHISAACRGRRKTAGGSRWVYEGVIE